MKLKILFLFLLIISISFSCKTDKPASSDTESKTTEIPLKDISELSYLEIYHALFVNKNGGFDAHGDLYGQEAVSSISFITKKSSCGDSIFLQNDSTTQTITLAMKASFNFPGNPQHEMLRAYTLKPTEKVSIGNSKLCYNGKEYTLKKEIVSAGFTNN